MIEMASPCWKNEYMATMEECSILWELGLGTGNLGRYLKLKWTDTTSSSENLRKKDLTNTNGTTVRREVSVTMWRELSTRRDDNDFSLFLMVAPILKRWGNRSFMWLLSLTVTGPDSSSCFSIYSILSKAFNNICSNLCTKGAGNIAKVQLNLQPRSLVILSCLTEFMPTAFRCALASHLEDKTKYGKDRLSLLLTSLLRILIYQVSLKNIFF